MNAANVRCHSRRTHMHTGRERTNAGATDQLTSSSHTDRERGCVFGQTSDSKQKYSVDQSERNRFVSHVFIRCAFCWWCCFSPRPYYECGINRRENVEFTNETRAARTESKKEEKKYPRSRIVASVVKL